MRIRTWLVIYSFEGDVVIFKMQVDYLHFLYE